MLNNPASLLSMQVQAARVHASSKALLIAADVCALLVPLRISRTSEERCYVGVVDLHDSVAWFSHFRLFAERESIGNGRDDNGTDGNGAHLSFHRSDPFLSWPCV